MNNSEKLFKITGDKSSFNSELTKKVFSSKYNEQAIDFLLETETKCIINSDGQLKPTWSDTKVNAYKVTLKNKNHSYTFTFYDSIHNTENKKSTKWDFYSVLACLGSYYPESFDDFISEFGYEINTEGQYIKAKQTHLDCLNETKNLKKLFNEEQLEKLQEIA